MKSKQKAKNKLKREAPINCKRCPYVYTDFVNFNFFGTVPKIRMHLCRKNIDVSTNTYYPGIPYNCPVKWKSNEHRLSIWR